MAQRLTSQVLFYSFLQVYLAEFYINILAVDTHLIPSQ
jgi:hypothetical protein